MALHVLRMPRKPTKSLAFSGNGSLWVRIQIISAKDLVG